MQTREQVIKGLEKLRVVYHSNQMLHPKDFVNQHDMEAIDNALDLLKSLPQEYPKDDFSDHFLGLSEMAFVASGPRILTMEEINAYIIDVDADGKAYPKYEQVARCGNAVCPPIPTALVRANLPELCPTEASA